MMRLRRRRRRQQIDPGFARVLAAQVAVGTAALSPTLDPLPEAQRYQAAADRSRASLAMIGLMLARACPDDLVVQETLSQRLEREHRADGGTVLRRVV